jgi:uncharacterized membrane protein
MQDRESPKNRRDFLRIITASSALAFGAMVASLYSLRRAPSGFRFQFNTGSALVFLAGAALAWGYWRTVSSLPASAEGTAPGSPTEGLRQESGIRKRVWFILYSIGLALISLICFLVPIRHVAEENRRDIVEGLFMALGAIALVVLILWRLIRWLGEMDRSK